jgi:hypothetical protein
LSPVISIVRCVILPQDDKSSSGEETSFEVWFTRQKLSDSDFPSKDSSLPDVRGRDLKGRVIQNDLYPFAGGGNSNIYRGKLTRSDGRKIRVSFWPSSMSSVAKICLFLAGCHQNDPHLG